MSYIIENKKLNGTVRVPSSKSYAHRAIICASLAIGRSLIHNVDYNDDIEATINALKALGTIIIRNGNTLEIDGTTTFMKRNVEIDCNESGSTLRFLVPVSLICESQIHFTGKGELGKRPMNIYYDIFEKQGIGYLYRENALDLYVRGMLSGGVFEIPGDVSSQFISGLLFALPLCDQDSKIIITTPLQSKDYVLMTIDVLKHFGVYVMYSDNEIIIPGGQFYSPKDYYIEGDYSAAANYIGANVLGNHITIEGLNKHTLQGDRIIEDIITSYHDDDLHIDGSQCIDIVPLLSLICSVRKGQSTIYNIERLKYKESDRLHATIDVLTKLGASIKEEDDSLFIEGVTKLHGAHVSSYHDHRIAMMIAIASSICDGEIIVDDMECVKKSYPMFIEHFKQLGGIIDVGD